jgi:low affinity Fe/Cu permease
MSFDAVARWVSRQCGRPSAFLLAVASIVAWAMFGPASGYSDTWQLVINTSTTVITFLMVFLIQASQNRDADALQLKIDELIRAISEASDELIGAENASQDARDAFRVGRIKQ